jgi:adenylate cyclase
MSDDEELQFARETGEIPAPFTTSHWPVIIVDDEEEVHSVTKLVLSDFRFDDRPLKFLSAYSASDARKILKAEPLPAIMLVDVVMESDDAGLQLVRYLRDDLRNLQTRVILRTGQPGHAPERQVILDYHINDYKSKAELTAQKLFTSIVSALRSFQDIERISAATREKNNLSRYFSPNMVNFLANSDDILGDARESDVAVVFADIIGFTRLAERMSPQQTIELLRDFSLKMIEAVFAHDGTLDKFIGDGVMASFGTPIAGALDATRALRCVYDMACAATKWNEDRARAGGAPVQVGVGAHYGKAVIGDIGDHRRVEFTVVGDTVNVASRLEHLTREFNVSIVVSDELIEAVRRERANGVESLLGLFERGQSHHLNGRDGSVVVWLCRIVNGHQPPAGPDQDS